jgi:hypothetical protein
MTDQIQRLQVLSTDDPSFAEVARMVNIPPVTPEGKFFPAYDGFNIGAGSDVDISWLDVAAGYPYRVVAGFDRHLHTEELFIATEGDFYFPAAPCRHPDDPEDMPTPEDFRCWHIKQGDMFVLKPNVWHDGCWPVDANRMVRFIMILSGHRGSASGLDGRVDHIVKRFPEGVGILVDAAE